MKTVREVMNDDLITIHPSSTIKTAVILMRGHEIGALPVVNEEALLGLLENGDVLGADPSLRVDEVMSREFVSVEPDLPVQKAADLMAKTGATRLLVVDQGSLVGIVTHSDVLPVLGRSYDPLTGLPWSDTLREWGVEKLANGDEISILFFDLDNFGMFNKQYGHLIGDAVLKVVSSVMTEAVNPDTEILCHIGGDEFGICSIRPRSEAEQLAFDIAQAVSNLKVDKVTEPISTSYGVSGGRRTKEREIKHFVSTFNDLLNKASTVCQEMKKRKREEWKALEETRSGQTRQAALESDNDFEGKVSSKAPETAEASAAQEAAGRIDISRLRIDQITYTASDFDIRISVRLTLAGKAFEQSVSGQSAARPVIRLVADACAGAVQMAIPGDRRIVVQDVSEHHLVSGETILLSTVSLMTTRDIHTYYGIGVVRRGDTHRAAAASVLSALNRPLGGIV